MEGKDIRWHQRLKNYNKALAQLQKFIDKGQLNELEEQGLIQAFEYTFELSWTLMKDYYEYQGEEGIQGSRDAFRLAFKRGLITNGEDWMKMIESRIKSSHTYNEETADEIVDAVLHTYHHLFISFQQTMNDIHNNRNRV